MSLTIIVIATVVIGAAAYFIKRKKLSHNKGYVMPYQQHRASRFSFTLRKKTPIKKRLAPSPDLVVLNLFAANDYGYGSYELMQAFSNVAVCYGPMNIFHRYDSRGSLLFSIASITQPGTFDLNTIGSFSTPGLVLFAEMDKVADPLATFDAMIEAASRLIEELGGTLYEDRYSPMTQAAIENIRARLDTYAHAIA